MKQILTIMKKELYRFFTDRRMVMSLILPAALIYIIYSAIGSATLKRVKDQATYLYKICIVNEPSEKELAFLDSDCPYKIDKAETTSNIDEIKQKIANNEIDLYIKYEDDFYQKMMAYDSTTGAVPPQIEIYYNSGKEESELIYQYYVSCLNDYEAKLTNKFDINSDVNINYDLASKDEKDTQFVTMLLPFLIIVLLFSSCLSIASESIAGEKERGTIATLLITPVKRSSIALGKIFAISVTAFVGAIANFIGLVAALPKLVAGANLSMSMYNVGSYVGLLFIIVSTVLIFIAILSIISTFAKSVKEASSYSIPVMLLVMLIAATSLIGKSNSQTITYFIPIYNSVQAMGAILSLNFNPINFVITIVTNLAIFALGIVILSKMFNSEKIMFNA